MHSCLITGANSGIGLAIAEHYWQKGWTVAGVDLDQQGTAFSERCKRWAAQKRAHYYHADVRDPIALGQICTDLTAKTRVPISIVFANAGVLAPSKEVDKGRVSTCEVMSINYFGVINTVNAALQHMDNNGFIVVSSSISALSASQHSGTYAASKAAIDRWTEEQILAQNTLETGPTYVVARIGFVDTPMTKDLRHAQVLAISARAAARRMAGKLRRGKHCVWVGRRSVMIFVLLDLIGLQHRMIAMNAAYKVKCWLDIRAAKQ